MTSIPHIPFGIRLKPIDNALFERDVWSGNLSVVDLFEWSILRI